jgi:5-formyltetrahydrofolate cyclo-ligase
MDKGLIERLSIEICSNIYLSEPFKQAIVVALYHPARCEVDVMHLLDADSKMFVFPRVSGERLEFAQAGTRGDFKKGAYGISEPVHADVIDVKDISLILVPGIVFDRNGYRLGYGKGFYDRLLSEYPDIDTMGVCCDEFVLESLQRDPWDARVDYIVTQNGLFKTREEVATCH